MAPEITAALIGGAAALACAVVGLLPAVAAILRRQRGAVEADGTATRDAVTALSAQLGSVKDELRTDVFELRAHVVDVRAWQAGHDAEHFLHTRQNRGDS